MIFTVFLCRIFDRICRICSRICRILGDRCVHGFWCQILVYTLLLPYLARACSVRAPSPSEKSFFVAYFTGSFSVHSSAEFFRDHFLMGFFRVPLPKVLSHLLIRKGISPCALSQGFCRAVFGVEFFRAFFRWEFLRSLPCRNFFRMLSPVLFPYSPSPGVSSVELTLVRSPSVPSFAKAF